MLVGRAAAGACGVVLMTGKTSVLRVEKGGLLEQERDGLLIKVPMFVVDDAPRPDLARLVRGRGSIGPAVTSWTIEDHDGKRCAVMQMLPADVQLRPFEIVFPMDTWSVLLEAAVNVDELGLVLSTVAHLPSPYNGLALWIRGTGESLRTELEEET